MSVRINSGSDHGRSLKHPWKPVPPQPDSKVHSRYRVMIAWHLCTFDLIES